MKRNIINMALCCAAMCLASCSLDESPQAMPSLIMPVDWRLTPSPFTIRCPVATTGSNKIT